MAVTVLCDYTNDGVNGTCRVLVDYDDVAQTIGVTVTGTGAPTLLRCKAGNKSAKAAQALAALIGQPRTVVLTGIASTTIFPLDADGAPTKMDLALTWAS